MGIQMITTNHGIRYLLVFGDFHTTPTPSANFSAASIDPIPYAILEAKFIVNNEAKIFWLVWNCTERVLCY